MELSENRMRLGCTTYFITGVGVAVLFASALLAGCNSKPSGPPPGAMGGLPVGVVPVQQADVPLTGEWVGTLDGFVNAQIQPQVSGYLIRQDYREGSSVTKGQILFEIDPRPFQATLEQAEGQVGQAKGQVGQAQAQLGLAEINVKRDTPLAAQHAIAQSQLDNDKQQAAQAEATVHAMQAAVAAAQANVATTKLNLGFTKVRSLISGVAGQATIQVGNLVSPQSVLTSVSQLDPIKVYFSISDDEYLALTRQAQKGGRGDLLRSSSKIPLTLTLADGEAYPHTGHIDFVDRQMNQQTGAIRIAAVFPNPDNLLRPGQFGRVKAQTDVLHNALLIPQTAVQELQGIEQVFVVGSDNQAHLVNVTLGPQVGNDWVITSGLQPGARVVTDNLQKLKDGAPVSPHPAALTAPTSSASNGAAGS